MFGNNSFIEAQVGFFNVGHFAHVRKFVIHQILRFIWCNIIVIVIFIRIYNEKNNFYSIFFIGDCIKILFLLLLVLIRFVSL